MSPEVSVVIPCFNAVGFLARCLGSLAAQTLDRARFEAVLVFNGPDDGGEALARELAAEAHLTHQILHSEPGAGRARNVGIAAARGAWTTLLDADDELSADFLELMLESATDPTVVPVAGMLDETYDAVVSPWWFNATLKNTTGPQPPETFYPHLTVNAGKLIPTPAMQAHPFDENLRSGEDIVLYCSLFEDEGLSMIATPAQTGATYRRHITASSVSRQAEAFDFMVDQRLDVIEALNRQLRGGTLDAVRRTSIASQSHFLRRYLRQHPDGRAEVDAAIARRDLPRLSPHLRPTPPRQALVCRAFAPSGTPEVRQLIDWLVEGGEEWQAVSTTANDEPDWRLTWAAGLSVGRHDRIPVPPGSTSAAEEAEFCTAALASLDDMGELDTVVTIGSWAPAHLVGARHKERRGSRWVARLAKPLRHDVAQLALEADDVQFTDDDTARQFAHLTDEG